MKIKDPVSGLSHLMGLALAVVGVGWLVLHGSRDLGTLLARALYGVCLVALYAASSVYHLVPASEKSTRRLRLFDHLAIFLLVAGTCTPIFYRAFEGNTRLVMLGSIWLLAAAGVVFKLTWRGAPRWLYTALYVAMGWAVALRWSTVAHALPPAAWALVLAGGLTYTAGALIYAVRRPDPLPDRFGFHEIWHLFVLGGSALHYSAIAILSERVS